MILPDTLKEIGDYAFDGCDNLMTIEIPLSVTNIGKGFLDNYYVEGNIDKIKFDN